MKFNLLINNKAKKFIRNLINNNNEFQSMYINRWLQETRTVKCYYLDNEDKIVNIVLLSKMDYDPLQIHTNPYVLDYIYTFKEFRNQKNASKMIEYLKDRDQLTVFCDSVESENLFKNKQFLCVPYEQQVLFRYP